MKEREKSFRWSWVTLKAISVQQWGVGELGSPAAVEPKGDQGLRGDLLCCQGCGFSDVL